MLPPVTRWSLLLSTLDEVGVGTEGVFSGVGHAVSLKINKRQQRAPHSVPLLRLASCELSRGAYDSLSGVARAEVEVGRFESVPGLWAERKWNKRSSPRSNFKMNCLSMLRANNTLTLTCLC